MYEPLLLKTITGEPKMNQIFRRGKYSMLLWLEKYLILHTNHSSHLRWNLKDPGLCY